MESNITNNLFPIVGFPLKMMVLFAAILFQFACDEIKTPKPEIFIGENVPPPKQELRWSNGKMPKSFDPARASASPETDFVRALFEGLTDIDSKDLTPNPALAIKWTASEDYRVWTFQLRRDAKWSNGKPVTAHDFVVSWKRLAELGEKVPQRNLLKNIVGMDSEDVMPVFADEQSEETENEESSNAIGQKPKNETNSNNSPNPKIETVNRSYEKPEPLIKLAKKEASRFGAEAVGDFKLKVTLIHPDKEFSVLVAHPIFHPVYGNGKEFEVNEPSANIVTNGAFKLVSIAKDGIVLERSPIYWDKEEVKLEKVKFVPTDNAESALAAYRAGQVDAVTNANFQPLALKLLKPFDQEFKQTVHGALNFYEFNVLEKPFDDLRVREALAISIERERLTEDELDGATKPAFNFLPFEASEKKLEQNVGKAKKLLAEAGFANGENFPTIKLVINRNNIQQKIARSIARMWQKNLNLKTDIIVKDQAEFQNSIQTGDFSLARRGIVLPTNNETANMLAMFHEIRFAQVPAHEKNNPEENEKTEVQILNEKTAESKLDLSENEKAAEEPESLGKDDDSSQIDSAENLILTEDEALERLPGIPLYFPNSYSLVKPYVRGFELNAFDALSLKNVQIDSNWQPIDALNGSNK